MPSRFCFGSSPPGSIRLNVFPSDVPPQLHRTETTRDAVDRNRDAENQSSAISGERDAFLRVRLYAHDRALRLDARRCSVESKRLMAPRVLSRTTTAPARLARRGLSARVVTSGRGARPAPDGDRDLDARNVYAEHGNRCLSRGRAAPLSYGKFRTSAQTTRKRRSIHREVGWSRARS
jgi:hypothetical protein